MNKLLVKYSIEFVVVVLGSGLSFYVDDLRQHVYDVELQTGLCSGFGRTSTPTSKTLSGTSTFTRP